MTEQEVAQKKKSKLEIIHKNGLLSDTPCSQPQEEISEDDHHSVCLRGLLSSENKEMIIQFSDASQNTSPAHKKPA